MRNQWLCIRIPKEAMLLETWQTFQIPWTIDKNLTSLGRATFLMMHASCYTYKTKVKSITSYAQYFIMLIFWSNRRRTSTPVGPATCWSSTWAPPPRPWTAPTPYQSTTQTHSFQRFQAGRITRVKPWWQGIKTCNKFIINRYFSHFDAYKLDGLSIRVLERVRLNVKNGHQCEEDENYNVVHCMEKYLTESVGCQSPWSINQFEAIWLHQLKPKHIFFLRDTKNVTERKTLPNCTFFTSICPLCRLRSLGKSQSVCLLASNHFE